jgi:hydroxymethylpyrimidine pyrophosphatase-like HAD family hydrolase
MLSCYTYEIIPDKNNNITTKITEEDVISHITQHPKTQTIYLAFDNDNGWKYFYRQYIWDGEKVLKFKEDLLYEVQYSTPTINTLRGNIENQQENINTITQDSEYNLESIAQTLNSLIDDLLIIKSSLNLSSDITNQLKVLQDATQKMSYDSVTKRYQSNVITTTGKLNPSLNIEQIKKTLV